MISGKKVIIVLGSLELGGAERQALLLARYLKNEQGAHVQIWGFGAPGKMTQLCERNGIACRSVQIELPRNPVRLLANLVGYARKLRNERLDILLAYTILPNVVCGLVWRVTGAKVYIWNQRDAGVQRFWSKTLERIAVLNTCHFVSNSHQGPDFLANMLRLNRKTVRIIHNGIELDSPEIDRLEWLARLDVSERCIVACMVANLSSLKDHITLLKAWRIIIDRLEQNEKTAVLLLAGRFDQNYEMLKEMSVRLNLGESVRFLGQVEDVAGLLGAVDLGVFSSHSEGMPNGVLECMAAGLPVAATDIPGIRAAVGPDGYTFLAPPGYVSALADKILLFVRSSELRDQVGAANRRRIAQKFNPQQMCDQMVALITQYV